MSPAALKGWKKNRKDGQLVAALDRIPAGLMKETDHPTLADDRVLYAWRSDGTGWIAGRDLGRHFEAAVRPAV